MFRFLLKIVHHASAAQELQCLQKHASLIFHRHSSTNANKHSFTVSYLVNSCGLSLDSALSASKYVHFESPENPDSVLDFFRKHGFSKPQITNICRKTPGLLKYKPEKSLLPKLEFFQSIGILSSELARMLSFCPYLFSTSLENFITPGFSSLTNLLQSSEKAVSVIRRYPFILRKVDHILLPNVKILEASGVPQSNIAKYIYFWPISVLTNTKLFEKSVAAIKEMGIDPLRIQFVIAIMAISICIEGQWERKLSMYKSWDLSEEEILAAFRKCPWIMITSEDKVVAKMDFLVNHMGWESSVIIRHPVLITLSLEKRIIPRCAVFQFLLARGLIKESTNFFTLLTYPEKSFLRRCVDSYDEAPQLVKVYHEKLNLSPSKKTKELA